MSATDAWGGAWGLPSAWGIAWTAASPAPPIVLPPQAVGGYWIGYPDGKTPPVGSQRQRDEEEELAVLLALLATQP